MSNKYSMDSRVIHLHVIRVDGTEEHQETTFDRWVSVIDALIGASLLDNVQLSNGDIMWCDDAGYEKSLPINYKASKLYHSVCRLGTTYMILGDVVITNEADFPGDI